MPAMNLLVIRVSDPERSRAWYERLGFGFREERHGDGPVHYAAVEAGFVFELYPASASNPVSSTIRLGFRVPDVRSVLERGMAPGSVVAGPDTRSGDLVAVLVDPDGIKVEISGPRASTTERR